MTKVAHQTWMDRPPRSKLAQVGPDLALAVIPLATVATTTWWLFGLPVTYFGPVGAAYACLAGIVAFYLPMDLARRGFGPANRVTLGRATLILPLAALVLQPVAVTGPLAWYVIGLASVALVLDGVDGWMARRSETSSAFGARFDMELDSFLMLVLALLAWRSGRVGSWAVLIGLPRYLFVAAGWAWPRLQAELPPSLRRKAVCVVQGALLLVCLGPIIPAPLATTAAATALVVLGWSFAIDIVWLVRRRPDGPGA